MQFKKPKKGKTKAPNAKTLRHAYYRYIKGVPTDSAYRVPEAVYTGICASINEQMMKAVIELDVMEYSLGPYIGKLMPVKRKTSTEKQRVNWNLSKKYGKLIYHDNRHTNGFYCSLVWMKSNVLPSKKFVKFQPLRRHDRYMSNLFAAKKIDYPAHKSKWANKY